MEASDAEPLRSSDGRFNVKACPARERALGRRPWPWSWSWPWCGSVQAREPEGERARTGETGKRTRAAVIGSMEGRMIEGCKIGGAKAALSFDGLFLVS